MLEVGLIIRLVVLSVNVMLGVLAYKRNPRSATNILLALMTGAIFLWGVANEFSIHATTLEGSLIWIRMVMVLATPLAVLFFLLMYTFPRATLSISKRLLALIFSITVFSMAVAASPYLFVGISSGVGSTAKPVPGPGMIIFLATAISSILLGLISLIKKNIKLKGLERLQARYLLLGTSVMFALILGAIFFPVIIIKNSEYVKYAILFTFPFVATTAYAIARYRLMDIKKTIAYSLSFTFLVGTFFLIYAVLFVFAVPFVARIFEISPNILAGAGALLSLPLARYTQKILRRLTDKFLFQGKINYHAESIKISYKLSRTIQIEEVIDIVTHAMEEILRASKMAIFLKDAKDNHFFPRAFYGIKNLNLSIPNDHALITNFEHNDKIILKDEISFFIEKEKDQKRIKELTDLRQIMDWIDASVIIPLSLDKGVTGFIVLGERKSGEQYSSDDIEFLASLAPQASIALENAKLYKESLEFGDRLKKEVKQATQELEEANRQLKNLDKAKSEFLSIASHQLYTPLTALRGYLSMLIEGDFGKLSDKQKPVINILNKSAVRLIELIKNLLDISRIESGRLELNLESVDLVLLSKELVQDLMPNAMNKRLKLNFFDPTEVLPHVVADRERIRQVMLNFVDNAIKYTKKGRVNVHIRREDDELIFSVADTGKGLSANEIPRLFVKFTRVGGASRFHTEGVGLGLYVARQIVQEHHGEIEAQSPGKNKGSTFSMRLPIEGMPKSLKLGEKATVVIKAAEAIGKE